MVNRVLVVNAHEVAMPFVKGQLNSTLTAKAVEVLKGKGYEVETTVVADGWDVEQEHKKWAWATHVFIQSPMFWYNIAPAFKRYQDQVFAAGMQGALTQGDGRSADDRADTQATIAKYGTGGKLTAKYMLSFTCNSPEAVFSAPSNPLMKGLSIDDVLVSQHLTLQFLGVQPLPTFTCTEVMEKIRVDEHLQRLEVHLNAHF